MTEAVTGAEIKMTVEEKTGLAVTVNAHPGESVIQQIPQSMRVCNATV